MSKLLLLDADQNTPTAALYAYRQDVSTWIVRTASATMPSRRALAPPPWPRTSHPAVCTVCKTFAADAMYHCSAIKTRTKWRNAGSATFARGSGSSGSSAKMWRHRSAWLVARQHFTPGWHNLGSWLCFLRRFCWLLVPTYSQLRDGRVQGSGGSADAQHDSPAAPSSGLCWHAEAL